MVTIDCVGVPIPVDHPEFRSDKPLLKKIKQVESLIEIEHDIRDTKVALTALRNSLKNENHEEIISLFNCFPWTISESILSYIVVLYAKAFTEGTGRTRLNAQVENIFGKDIDKHEYTMELRHSFYAHHRIEANRHQLFCLPHSPSRGKVELNPSGQTTRILMPTWIKLEKIEFCILKVEEYLNLQIKGLCKAIEDGPPFPSLCPKSGNELHYMV
ncbi:MAG: hypothetical protein SWH78_17165 [Thermodesulfobacteriota bacterium]|nr:hypothetical protein [Thermodesulfobacteriota bacterium]